MKNINYLISLILLGLTLTSCKKDFLVAKQDFTGVNEQVFETPEMATAYVDYIYGLIQPTNGNGTSLYWELSAGNSFTATTEELGGETDFNKVWPQIAITQNHAFQYFGAKMSTSIGNNTWTRLKQINIFIKEIDKHGLLPEVWKPLKGQMYFWRAWQYFDLVRLYGGVPLVLEPQDPIATSIEENSIPRSSTSACIDQICTDLDSAINMLPGKWTGSDWGRITSGAAAALKGRVLLTWASPLFNRDDNTARWQRAYDANKAARTLLEENGFALYNNGTKPGEAWGKMWFQQANNPEAVMIYGFNTVTADQTKKNNGWEQSVRSKEVSGGGSISPTRQMVDAFPMLDGKMPGESSYTYDPNKFYKNRDPRFYKTFAYNGALWPYKENTKFIQWTYKWYKSGTDPLTKAPDLTTETKGANATGIYLCKASDPAASNSSGNFSLSGTDIMKIRFAEVVLNLAECAIGVNKLSEGLAGIKEIRGRAGIEKGDDGNYGLNSSASRDELFRAVLDERKVEFAYEGLRFWDLRRWMLFDASSPYAIRLGLQDEALNGKRRTGYYIIATKDDGTPYKDNTKDPFHAISSTITPGLFERAIDTADHPGFSSYGEYLDNLYDHHFKVVEKDDIDKTGATPNWVFTWYDEYYFFGLHRNILSVSPYLEQTKGWPDINGAPGTFDPLK